MGALLGYAVRVARQCWGCVWAVLGVLLGCFGSVVGLC
jgi:hypothetical protein